MSREIKFRVWSEDQKTYDYKFPYNSIGDFYVSSRGKVFSDFGNTVAPEVRQEAFIVEQYTGLKDRNGKEIYEGDIVTMEYDLDDLEPSDYYVITFSDGCFRISDIHETEVGSYLSSWQIMGNIHENLDLIGGKDE